MRIALIGLIIVLCLFVSPVLADPASVSLTIVHQAKLQLIQERLAELQPFIPAFAQPCL